MRDSILLIEDDDKHSFVMEDILSDEGYEVEIAKNKKEILKKIAERGRNGNPFDLILTDIALSEFDAIDFIKNNHITYRIIVVSAFADAKIANGVLNEKWFIRKPFDNYALLERVKERLDLPI
ncbi:response regulator [Acidobacteriota bacterium]